eukprot:COSAG02_NODE_77_length_40635_cov_56.355980_4_plen_2303_part_00
MLGWAFCWVGEDCSDEECPGPGTRHGSSDFPNETLANRQIRHPGWFGRRGPTDMEGGAEEQPPPLGSPGAEPGPPPLDAPGAEPEPPPLPQQDAPGDVPPPMPEAATPPRAPRGSHTKADIQRELRQSQSARGGPGADSVSTPPIAIEANPAHLPQTPEGPVAALPPAAARPSPVGLGTTSAAPQPEPQPQPQPQPQPEPEPEPEPEPQQPAPEAEPDIGSPASSPRRWISDELAQATDAVYATVQEPDEMAGQPDAGRSEWWERVAGVDEEDLLEIDVENGAVQDPTSWWQQATGVMKHREQYVTMRGSVLSGDNGVNDKEVDTVRQFKEAPTVLDARWLGDTSGPEKMKPPPLPLAGKKYLGQKPLVAPKPAIRDVPAAVQAILSGTSGPNFGFAHPDPAKFHVDPFDVIDDDGDKKEAFADSILDRSCFVFSEESIIRRVARATADSFIFEISVLLLIAGNSLTLAMYDPVDPDSDSNQMLEQVGTVFTVLFAVEMFTKIIAFGFAFGDEAYLGKNENAAWNRIDFVVVTSGLVELAGVGPDLGVLRVIRLLRPLRTITSIRGMRVLVGTLLQPETLAGIGNVCLLCMFIFIVWGIIGVNMFGGQIRSHCVDMVTFEMDEDQMCGGRYTCPAGTYCSAVNPLTGETNPNPENGMISFDDFPMSVLTVFTMMTLEGWTDVMYMVQDGFTPWAWIYFVILVCFGTFIAINMFLAVISAGYEKMAEEVDEEQTMRDNAEYLLKCLSEAINDALTWDHTQDEKPAEKSTNIHEGDYVRLKESAHIKYPQRGRGNLTQPGGPTPHGRVLYFDRDPDPAKAPDDPANEVQNRTGTLRVPHRVRVTTVNVDQWKPPKGVEVSKLIQDQQGIKEDFWYLLDDIERTHQTREDNERDRNLEEARKQEYERYKQQRIEKFFDFFDEDKSDSINRKEFVRGLRKLAQANPPTDPNQPMTVTQKPKKKRVDPGAIVIKDQRMRALLHLITADNLKGNDREWQKEMTTLMFGFIDDDDSGQLTMTEFETQFLDERNWKNTEVEPDLTRADLDNIEEGTPIFDVVALHCKYIVTRKWFQNFIVIVVLVNCVVLANAGYGKSRETEQLLEDLNFYCTLIFIFEFFAMLMGLGPRVYVQDNFNCLDGLIVIASILELFVFKTPEEGSDESGGGMISVFRALRILRVFKITKSMENFRRVLQTIASVVPEMSNFFALLCLFIFFFSVMGLHLFGGTFEIFAEQGDPRRSTFDTFGDSVLSVFQILTGENWNALMYDTVETNGKTSIAYFVIVNILGVYVMLNLFLAVLLLKTTEAFMPQKDPRDEVLARARVAQKKLDIDAEEPIYRLQGKTFFVLGANHPLRQGLLQVLGNTYFENTILFAIFVSSAALAVEEPNQAQEVLDILVLLDYIFTALFIFEMVAKIIVVGLYLGPVYQAHKDPDLIGPYFKEGWNILDGAVVCCSVIAIILSDSNLGWVRGFRVFRALRPLRVIKRVPELKTVVESLFRSAPTLGNVILLLSMFWLIFGILGVQLFAGKFYYCNDGDVYGSYDCVGSFVDAETGDLVSRDWDKPLGWGFDNIGEAVITLFEVSTLEMWLDIMYLGIDAVGIDKQPLFEYSPAMAGFFVTFIALGSFFLLELFVGATVTSYNMINIEAEGSGMQSERQKQQVAKMVLKETEDEPDIKYDWQMSLYKLTTNSIFENLIMLCIVLNIVLMALGLAPADMSDEYVNVLAWFNEAFTWIFAGEFVLKLGALFPSRYFRNGWNVYDWFVVTVTMTELIYKKIDPTGEIPGASIMRVFRILRVFRLLRNMKGLTKLLMTVLHAMPTVVNVAGVLFLLFYIAGVLGMHLFGRVQRGEFLNEHANFESFFGSVLVVFRMSTGESWNGIMNECRVSSPPDCDPEFDNGPGKPVGNCGSFIAIVFFAGFQIVGQYIMLNLFIAVMLEYYQREQDATTPFMTDNDFKVFETTWTNFCGREARHPYGPNMLMPVQLFDSFMEALPPHIGWSPSERISAVAKSAALRRAPFNRIPVRALKVLIPWSGKPGHLRALEGLAKYNEYKRMKESGQLDIQSVDLDPDLDDQDEEFATPWAPQCTEFVAGKMVNGCYKGVDPVPSNADPPRKKPAYTPNDDEYWRKRGSYVVPIDPGLREPGVRYRLVPKDRRQRGDEHSGADNSVTGSRAGGGGGAEEKVDHEDKTGGIKLDRPRPGQRPEEPDWATLNRHGKTLKDGGVEWEREDPELRMMEKYGVKLDELPRTYVPTSPISRVAHFGPVKLLLQCCVHTAVPPWKCITITCMRSGTRCTIAPKNSTCATLRTRK